MKTDTLWLAAFALGFIFSFAVMNSSPGIGIFLGVNSLVAVLWYFGRKNNEAKELKSTFESETLLKVLTGMYVLLTLPYLYRLDYMILGILLAFHVVFLVLGALYFALPSALHILDIISLILSPIIFLLTWFVESIKSIFELFKENANTVKLLLKVVLYAAASLLVFILFAQLLAAADAEFKVRIDKILESLDLIVVMQRTVIAVVMSFVSAGLLTIIGQSKVLPLLGTTAERAKNSWDKAFTLVMSKRSDALLPVIITAPIFFLFLLYVWVQISYLFGQDVTAILAKYSFADYARRGFVELLVVGALTYPLLSWSMSQAKSEWKVPRFATFTINSGIVALLVIMLYSLITRMNLYMSVYGPSVLRTYVIVGAVFVGIALVLYELLAIKKAMKPGFAVFMGHIMTDYVIVAILSVLGLLAVVALVPWNSIVGKQIIAHYNTTGKLDVYQVMNLPLENEALVYQFGKSLESGGLREAGLLLQAHATQEVVRYQESREDSIFSKVFGFNLAGMSLLRQVDTSKNQETTNRFTEAMNNTISSITNGFIEALQTDDFAKARSYYDPEMQKNDIAGFSYGVFVIGAENAHTVNEKIARESYVNSFISGMTTATTYNLLYIKRLNENSVETSLTNTLGFRNGRVYIMNSDLILAYLPDAVSQKNDRYEIGNYGYRTFCVVPNLEAIYSGAIDCLVSDSTSPASEMIEKPPMDSAYSPMGYFRKSDFVTQR